MCNWDFSLPPHVPLALLGRFWCILSTEGLLDLLHHCCPLEHPSHHCPDDSEGCPDARSALPFPSGVCHCCPLPQLFPFPVLPTLPRPEVQACPVLLFFSALLPVSQNLLPREQLPCSLAGCYSVLGSCRPSDSLFPGSCALGCPAPPAPSWIFINPEAASQLLLQQGNFSLQG